MLCESLRRNARLAGAVCAAYRVLQAVLAQAAVAQYSRAESGALSQYAQQQMLRSHIAVAKAERGKPRLLDRALGLFGEFLVVLQDLVPPRLIF